VKEIAIFLFLLIIIKFTRLEISIILPFMIPLWIIKNIHIFGALIVFSTNFEAKFDLNSSKKEKLPFLTVS